MTVEQTSPRRPEEERYWREFLIKLGCTREQADVLSRRGDVDLHEVAEVIRAGCDPCVAFDIYS